MNAGHYDSLAVYPSPSPSLLDANSCSSTSSCISGSVFSDATSQFSDNFSFSSLSSDSSACDPCCHAKSDQSYGIPSKSALLTDSWKPIAATDIPAFDVVPIALRQNPRRTCSSGTTSFPGVLPALVRQVDRKANFVDNLVDTSTQLVETVWPLSSVVCRNRLSAGAGAVLPLRLFIQETLRRSRTSYSTLQVALYYLILIKPFVPQCDFTMEQLDDCPASRFLQCGRRMFLCALILASKYLQDRNYSARAWSKISGLATVEINQNELVFLTTVRWKLHVADDVFRRWTDIVLKLSPPPAPPSPPSGDGGCSSGSTTMSVQVMEWRKIVLGLSPALDNVYGLISCSSLGTKSCFSTRTTTFRSLAMSSPITSDWSASRANGDTLATSTGSIAASPLVMQPNPMVIPSPSQQVPAYGLLPTPQLISRPSEIIAPAVSVDSTIVKGSAMGMAMAQAVNAHATLYLDRMRPDSLLSYPVGQSLLGQSPLGQARYHRPSSQFSIGSTALSPESMVSDRSRSSRSSSVSSASSLCSTRMTNMTSIGRLTRLQHQKPLGQRMRARFAPETSSPVQDNGDVSVTIHSPSDSCAGSMAGLGDLCSDLALEEEHAKEAALSLAVLQQHGRVAAVVSPQRRPNLKRARPISGDCTGLHDHVRQLLRKPCSAWPRTMLRLRSSFPMPLPITHKRLCCSTVVSDNTMQPSNEVFIGPGILAGVQPSF